MTKRIGLIDVDGHNYPNLPLMKLSAYHKQLGDSVEWYDPLHSRHMDIVYMSKVFSFTPDYPYCVDANVVHKGGTGYAISLVDGKEVYDKTKDSPLPQEVEHIYPDYSLYPDYTKDTAYGFLTRGCPRNCDFCHVAKKEGRCSVKVADLSEFWRGQKNIVLCDPNILACPDRMGLLRQLKESGACVDFNQGLDIRLCTDEVLDVLCEIRLKSIHFAYDRYRDKAKIEPQFRKFAERMSSHLRMKDVYVYVLTNFDSTFDKDLDRIYFLRSLGFSPYVMIYDKEHCDPVYRRLARWVNSPFIFWKVPTFQEYTVTINKDDSSQISIFD